MFACQATTGYAHGAFRDAAEFGSSSNNSTQCTAPSGRTTAQAFISEDPPGFDGGDINIYAYAGNNPINETDPFGFKRLNYTPHPPLSRPLVKMI